MLRLTLPFLLLPLCFAPLGCDKVDVEITARGIAANNVRVEVKSLGRMTEQALMERAKKTDIDGVQRLPVGSCPKGPCHVALVTVFVKNTSPNALPPPVVRLEAPANRPRRVPVSLRAPEISVDYTGRIKWLVQLWPEETALQAHLSSSVWLVVDKPPKSDQAPPAPVPSAASAPLQPAPHPALQPALQPAPQRVLPQESP